MAEHRVLMLRDSLVGRRLPDRAADPRFRSIEDELAQLRVAPDPDPLFRADLRAQLVAIAPRLVAEGSPAEVEATGKHRAGTTRSAPATAPARHTDARGRRFPVMRSLRIVTAMLFVAALLLGGAYWQSRDALPGDNLYGLKRAGERVQLAFAGDNGAQDQLKFSEKRVAEVLALWKNGQPSAPSNGPRPAADVDAKTAALIRQTLDAANSELKAGASQLNRDAVRTKSKSPLQTMTTWASGQTNSLQYIYAAMKPTKTKLLTSVGGAAELVTRATDRANYWSQNLGGCKPAGTDEFGPVPCGATTSSRPPGQPSGGSSGSNGTSGTGGTGGTGGSSGGTGRSSGGTGGSTGRSSGGSGKSTSPGNRPTTARPSGAASRTGAAAPNTSKSPAGILPLPATPAKVSVGKCVSVSAGPINIGVGCPSS